MLSRVTIHVGPSKTGTTSIQHALSLFEKELAEQGICYPRTNPSSNEGQQSLAWEILQELQKPCAVSTSAWVTWASAFEQAEKIGAHTLLISAESFTLETFDDAAFQLLRRKLGDRELILIFALRDPAATVLSMWQQAVKWGFGFGEEIEDLDDAVPIIAARARIQVVPYLEQIERCCAPFETRMFTVPAKANPELLLRRFAEAAGFPEETMTAFSSLNVPVLNQPIPYEHTRLLLRLNRLMYDADPVGHSYPNNGDPFRLQARNLVLETLQGTASHDQSRPHFSQDANRRLQEIRESLFAWLNGRKVIGELVDLEGRPSAPRRSSSILPSIEEVAQLLCRTLLSVPQGQIQELRSYLKDVEGARDWWKKQSDAWEAELRSETERLLSKLAEAQTERDQLRAQAESGRPGALKTTYHKIARRR